MSNKNFDVELSITYDPAYKHYIPSYIAKAPAMSTESHGYPSYHYYISFDDGGETELGYVQSSGGGWSNVGSPYWWFNNWNYSNGNMNIPDTGIFEKAYFRNPHKDRTTFTQGNCGVQAVYGSKASFEVQWNSTGFAANQNASFKCSTIPKNTYAQYEWIAATVYYKESTDESYLSTSGIVSGTWSDVTISTNLTLTDNIVYDVYITATADDGSTATTPVAQFTTTDAIPVATCIAPSGAFTNQEVTFVWSHSTDYGTPQYAYDLEYSSDNGGSWTTVASHVVTTAMSAQATITDAGVYLWRVRTYNSNDVVGEWAEATFVNNAPASAPTNLQVSTKGRPTVSWVSSSQSAYQVQFLLGDSIAYDSGAVYTSETSHFVNQYFNDTRSYTVRVRIYNALGEVSDWAETGYQQPSVTDVSFIVGGINGATITVEAADEFDKYFLLRNNKLIAEIGEELIYTDKFAVGQVSYSVVGVTPDDQSDIQSINHKIAFEHATLTAENGQQFLINKRVDEAYEIQTTNEADINKANFIGDAYPTHYPSKMRLKSFSVSFFDDQGLSEDILGTLVFYADNFGNGGWCMVTAYEKTDNFVRNGQGVYANEVSLTLEVTNYDDSIEYPL